MRAFRHHLASGALALTVMQFVLLFAAPMSCCMPFRSAWHATKVESAAVAPQTPATEECPLHKSNHLSSRSEAQDSPCRMACDAPHGPQFLLGAIGVLPAPQPTQVTIVSTAIPAIAALATTARPALPDAPPPRLL